MWYVDSGASNHMKNHEEWISRLEKPEQSGFVKTDDDTSHPIEHIGDVPLIHIGQEGRLRNVLHVPMITKNLLSVGHIVDQGMQVRFTHLGCFIEEKQGQTILAMNDVDNAMFAKGQKVELDIGMWHKWIGHVNFQRLQDLQSK